jgi:RNA polymerase sigma factor (sigma-70 family)
VGVPDAGSSPDRDFVEFVSARQHGLLRASYLVCGDLRTAEDVLRAALVRLAREWGRIRDERPDLEVRRVLYRGAVASSRGRRPAPAPTTTTGSVDPERAEPEWGPPAWEEPAWGEPGWREPAEGEPAPGERAWRERPGAETAWGEPAWPEPACGETAWPDRDRAGSDDSGDDDEDADLERRRAVLRALETLTPRQRAVVVLQFYEDRGEPDISDILGISVGTVHVLAGEAVLALRVALGSADLEIGGAR